MSSIKLEAGKYYRSRDGRKFGPMTEYVPDRFCEKDGDGRSWSARGNGRDAKYYSVNPFSTPKLIAEWVDEPENAYYATPELCDEPEAPVFCPDCGVNTEYHSAIPSCRGNRPERVRILNDGAALTNGDRDDEYGPPANNMTCAGELKAVFRKWLARDIPPGELEALDMAMTKLSRLACGKPKRDTYVDAATYIAIAGEIALKS